jgi:hypothetical protein
MGGVMGCKQVGVLLTLFHLKSNKMKACLIKHVFNSNWTRRHHAIKMTKTPAPVPVVVDIIVVVVVVVAAVAGNHDIKLFDVY